MKEIKLQVPDGKKAEWKDINGVQMLVLIDEKVKENRPVTERVKTFEDACDELGAEHPFVKVYDAFLARYEDCCGDRDIADVSAYLKLRIITVALNEGWQPKFTTDEWRWYPWFCLWTEDELCEKDDEWKQSRALITTGGYTTDYAGLASAYSDSAPSAAYAAVGSHLCYKDKVLASYSGRQFADLWADFYLIRK